MKKAKKINCIIRMLIVYCSKQAYKYHKIMKMFVDDEEGLNYIYATGVMSINKGKWLKRIKWLQNQIK